MDGNGRWAQKRHRPRIIGHRAGARAVKACVEFCLASGVGALTLFAFSSENWNRPADEVGGLMKLFLGALEREPWRRELPKPSAPIAPSPSRASPAPPAARRKNQ